MADLDAHLRPVLGVALVLRLNRAQLYHIGRAGLWALAEACRLAEPGCREAVERSLRPAWPPGPARCAASSCSSAELLPRSVFEAALARQRLCARAASALCFDGGRCFALPG